ncbi:MAG: TatD family nuclease-associated radical SAM protein [Elusimicrobiales bacterium]|nr:TatD family nuclease-associated radical SAM protein [Elusimicrobiales bacterium]MCK5106216.1 TatD family nuclease-associated radical SAM protein [Elusimicrobiales bacterium]MCK5357790.1 TatD family nuclease-associated radical SAM protein [Elusimicrobiales bacterium]MCK5583352.1 TatD family nuclease-associated radical SAM protein [Elusimicrobiales bacterium]
MNTAKLVYRYNDSLYINLTNQCPTKCVFCIKYLWKMQFHGYNLDISKFEPNADAYIDAIGKEIKIAGFNEIIFCGYGEPTMRLAEMLKISSAIRAGKIVGLQSDFKIRLNTNGLGNLINKRNIVPELKGSINSVSISLNTMDPRQWLHLMNPLSEYREEGFLSVLQFIKDCSKNLDKTTITALDNLGADLEKLNALAKELNIDIRIRSGLEIKKL